MVLQNYNEQYNIDASLPSVFDVKNKGQLYPYAATESSNTSQSSQENNNDLTVKAGNRLYTQAIERLKRQESRRVEASGDFVTKRRVDTESQEDLTTIAGNRLYTQALERQKRLEERRLDEAEERKYCDDKREHDEYNRPVDLTVKAGNRLYTQAIERLRRHEAKQLEVSGLSDKLWEDLLAHAHNEKNSTVIAGNRLYTQAREQLQRQELKRTEASKPNSPKLNLATRKDHFIKSHRSADSGKNSISRCDHLYHLSSGMQMLGRQRRISIEDESARAKMLPESKVLPAYKNGEMYARSMDRLMSYKLKLAEKSAELSREKL